MVGFVGTSAELLIDGGEPIGIVGDTLNLITGGAPVMYAPGPETDEGGFQLGVPGTPISAPVSFDHIDYIAPITTPSVVVSGTTGSDDATLVQTGDQDFTLTTSGGRLTLGDHGWPGAVAVTFPQADVWRFPLETISNSDQGFERNYQGTTLLHWWALNLKPGETWQVELKIAFGAA